MNLRTKILTLLSERPGLSDREITDRVLGAHIGQQPVNQMCRLLESDGFLKREKIPGGRIRNYLEEAPQPSKPEVVRPNVIERVSAPAAVCDDLSEDAVKGFLETWLRSAGWTPSVAWGHAFGIDIEARRGGSRWVIEVKGCGSRQPMRVNYFLAILGELLQRMDDPNALYSLALPDMTQYRSLWNRLPRLSKERTGITALFVDTDGRISQSE